MTTFYLIRHAEKDAVEGVLAGRTPGIALSARGLRQAEALARHLRGERIDAVFSSLIQRAQETAAAIARDRGLGVELCEPITEVEFGEWTGASLSGLAPQERWRRFNTFRSGTPIPGGETALAVQARFVSEMLRLRDARPGGGVALVSHANPIRHGRWRFKGRLSGASGRLGETSLLLKRKRPALQRAW